jgi:hypothetical protein
MAFGCGTGALQVGHSEVDIIEEVSHEMLWRGGSWLTNSATRDTVVRLSGRHACCGTRPLDGEPGNNLRLVLVFQLEIFPPKIPHCPAVRVANDYWNEDEVHARAEPGWELAGVEFW